MSVHPDVAALNRQYRRRGNAATVMEEATAEMARHHQDIAEFWAASARRLGNPLHVKASARNYRLARRYLLALVGDGTPEDIPEHWSK